MVGVVFEHRAAAGRVHHDRRGAIALERLDVAAGHHQRALEVAAVGVERAAAALAGRVHHVTAGPLEHPNGSAVDVRQGGRHDAAGEERDPRGSGALDGRAGILLGHDPGIRHLDRPLGRVDLAARHQERPLDVWQERLGVLHPEQLDDAERPREPLDA
jgi:hypothetical protein